MARRAEGSQPALQPSYLLLLNAQICPPRSTTMACESPRRAVAIGIANAAALGAKRAVLEEVQLRLRVEAAAAEAVVQAGVDMEAGRRVSPHAMVAGVLPLPDAEKVASEGAHKAVCLAYRILPPASRELIAASLSQIQNAAAAGGAAGVRGSAFLSSLATMEDPLNMQPVAGQVLDRNMVAAAAGAGAWTVCYSIIRELPCAKANQWGSRLPPILGASLGMVATGYAHFSKAPDWVSFILYGVLFLAIFFLMIGVLAVPFSRSFSPELISRHATFAAFTTLTVFLTATWQISSA